MEDKVAGNNEMMTEEAEWDLVNEAQRGSARDLKPPATCEEAQAQLDNRGRCFFDGDR
jgi:hypothetical protein